MNPSEANEIVGHVKAFAGAFDERLARLMDTDFAAPPVLREAMRYALLSPGKRLRPFLVHQCCLLASRSEAPAGQTSERGATAGPPITITDDAFHAGAALEMVHAFSLVHDDLPAMDDDDLRRGRPTCHKAYGEANAILAGDALLALAFETLATRIGDAATATRLSAELGRATGWHGMIAGQVLDLVGEQEAPNTDLVRRIHEAKTAALFVAACRMGAIAGGADAATLERAGDFGRHLGLAFQIADDLLDVTASADELGKNVSKDTAHGKQTYPACVGMEGSRQAAEAAVAAAVDALAPFGPAADALRRLAHYTISRRH